MSQHIEVTTRLVVQGGDGEPETFTATLSGTCHVARSGLLLHYAEPDNGGHTSLILADGLVQLQREGHIKSQMTFVEGRMLPMPYTSPHGALDFSLFTHSARHTVHANGGTLHLQYSLLNAGQHLSDNTLHVEWRTTE